MPDTILEPHYIAYAEDVEQVESDERETIDKIVDLMTREEGITREKYDRSVRVSHAKAYGLLVGTLEVLDGLTKTFQQGLFAEPKVHPVLVRLAQVPGELVDDRKVSTPRGMSIKVFDVDGPMIPAHTGETTHDFVLDTGRAFIMSGAKSFLQAFKPNATIATRLSDTTKGAVSTMSRATNAALHAIGMDSATLDFYGHPFLHPVGEEYYTQAPFRYGSYIAQLRVKPDLSALKYVVDRQIEPPDENGLRTIVVEFFRTQPAKYDVQVQLCTDLDKMPVEDASKEWPEDESPFVTVARLTLPSQDAYSSARANYVEANLSFAPHHSLAAHRPLGSLNRARLAVYPVMAERRRRNNGVSVTEPRHISEIPN